MKRWILGTFFVWTLAGALGLAMLSSKGSGKTPVVAGQDKIAWQSSFEAALQTAKQEGKPALVVFESKDCTFCREMDRTTWQDARVQAQTRGYVSVKVDGDARLDLLQAYGVQGFPTALLVAGNGKPFAGKVGYVEPAEFSAFLGTSRAKWKA